MPKGLLRSGITAAFDKSLWEAIQIQPGYPFEIKDTLQPSLLTGIKKDSQSTPGIPAAISAEKDEDGNIVLLVKVVNAGETWLAIDGSNANQDIDIGAYDFTTTGSGRFDGSMAIGAPPISATGLLLSGTGKPAMNYGIDAQLRHEPQSAGGNVIALNFISYLANSSHDMVSAKGAVGVAGTIFNSGYSGTITDVIGFQGGCNLLGNLAGADPTATNATIFYGTAMNATLGAQIINAYGLRLADITAGTTSNYAIYTGAGNVSFGGNLFLRAIKSGATQAAAGAAANEIWKTSGHASLPDNVLMAGV